MTLMGIDARQDRAASEYRRDLTLRRLSLPPKRATSTSGAVYADLTIAGVVAG
jgi:hypothetical protein